jgi:hypothetical protein
MSVGGERGINPPPSHTHRERESLWTRRDRVQDVEFG